MTNLDQLKKYVYFPRVRLASFKDSASVNTLVPNTPSEPFDFYTTLTSEKKSWSLKSMQRLKRRSTSTTKIDVRLRRVNHRRLKKTSKKILWTTTFDALIKWREIRSRFNKNDQACNFSHAILRNLKQRGPLTNYKRNLWCPPPCRTIRPSPYALV